MGSIKEEDDSSRPPSCRAAAMKDLNKAQEFVARLANLLLRHASNENLGRASESDTRLLLEGITEKISKAIAVLGSGDKECDHMICHVKSPSPDASTKNSEMKRKLQSTRRAANRRRGNPYTWRTTSATTVDGYLWRKYGQKEIFTAKYPRSYYRCTHKYDRGCMATRQVQQSEEDPFLYVINYFGEHTCERANKNTTAIISFESNISNGTNVEIPFTCIPSQRQESDEEVLSSLSCIGSPSSYFMPPEPALQKTPMLELESGPRRMQSELQSSITSYGPEISEIFNFDYNELFQW